MYYLVCNHRLIHSSNPSSCAVLCESCLFQSFCHCDHHSRRIHLCCSFHVGILIFFERSDGLIHVYSFHWEDTSGVSLTNCFASAITPNGLHFDHSVVDSEVDCLVLFNHHNTIALLYTTSLDLRGIITLEDCIVSVHITCYGIVMITQSSVHRFTFCGEADGSIPISGMFVL